MIYPGRKPKQSWWSRRDRRRAWGFSMMEAVVSVGVTATLMGGMISVMSIASKASYNNSEAAENTYQARDTITQITTDLSLAESFTERTSTTAAFKVPDRNGDGLSESVRYVWSGDAGGTLTRQYNGGTIVTIAEDVHHFNLGYITKVVQPASDDAGDGEDTTVAALGDTTLRKGGSYDKRNYGGATVMIARNKNDVTGLVGFDISGVDFTIDSAKLRLYATSVQGSSKLIVYPMLHTASNASWYEGTSTGQQEVGAACYKYRSYQSSGSLKWENSSGIGQNKFNDIRGPAIGSIDPDSSYSVNQWIEIPLTASAVEAYRSSGSITLNIKYNSWQEMKFASKEHSGGNGPELLLSPAGAVGEAQESAEMALIGHDNASGGHFHDDNIKDDEWAAQYFKPTLPANTESWKINGVRIRLKKDGGTNGVISVQIRNADSNKKPTSSIRAQGTVNESDLSSSFQWVRVNFTPLGELSPDDGFCLVVGYSSGSSTIGEIEYEHNGNPMTSNAYWMTTSNSGSSWSSPSSSRDMRFTVYGTQTTLGDPE
ncbi:MAG: hypothetical protein QGH60_07440 [Phycisphaerae bacterium]|jgi:hypothetical protein|nr:hypothetical protein [Phycisphaerae bacterium]